MRQVCEGSEEGEIMGLGTKVLSFFTGVDVSSAATKTMGMLGNGLDMLVLTDEEKIQYNQKQADQWFDWAKQQKEENSLRSMARREIALLVCRSYVAMIWLSATCHMFDMADKAKFLFKLANVGLGTAFVAVIIFYFGGYYAEKIVNKK